mgnify:CR=1 FL=1
MLSHKKSLNILKKTNALLEGHFVLSSGLHSSKYIQCAKLLSFPDLADKICKSLANKIKKKTTKYLIFGFKTLKVVKHKRYSVVYPYNYKKINKLC